MGWFSRLTTVTETELTPQEAFAGVLLGAVSADGEVGEEEAHGLTAVLCRMRLYAGWHDGDFRRAFRRLSGDLQRDGLAGLLPRIAAALPAHLREPAFVNACDLVLADGHGADAESRYLVDLQGHLQISDDFAARVAEVLTAKNSG